MTRYFYFALVAIVLAASAFAPAQSPRSSHKASAVTKPATASLAAQSATAALAAGTSSQPQALACPPKPCDSREQHTKLRGAQFESDNLRLASAAHQFSALTTSCDDGVRAEAEKGFDRLNAAMSTWWWLEGRYFPPLRWYHHPQFWHAVSRSLLVVAAVLFILSLLFYGADIRAFHLIRVVWTAVLDLTRIRDFWFVDRFPRAAIMTPTDLVTDTKSKLFASLLETSCTEVSHVLERAGGGLQVRATALLSLPSETTSQLVDSMPKIKGVDVASFVKFFLYLKRYLGWRVESEIGYCPPTKQPNGADSAPRVVASASLRRAFWVRGGPWQVKHEVQHSYDVDAVAFALAARIMGFSLRGRRAR